MPYFIKQTAEGWDTVKDDGEVLGKHKTKLQAITQGESGVIGGKSNGTAQGQGFPFTWRGSWYVYF